MNVRPLALSLAFLIPDSFVKKMEEAESPPSSLIHNIQRHLPFDQFPRYPLGWQQFCTIHDITVTPPRDTSTANFYPRNTADHLYEGVNAGLSFDYQIIPSGVVLTSVRYEVLIEGMRIIINDGIPLLGTIPNGYITYRDGVIVMRGYERVPMTPQLTAKIQAGYDGALREAHASLDQ